MVYFVGTLVPCFDDVSGCETKQLGRRTGSSSRLKTSSQSLTGKQRSESTPKDLNLSFSNIKLGARMEVSSLKSMESIEIGSEESSQTLPPSASVLNSLQILCADPRNQVFIISERSKEELSRAFRGVSKLGLIAELGFYFSWPDDKTKGEKLFDKRRETL